MSTVPPSGTGPAAGGGDDGRLARRLGVRDAVVVGLGAMLGAGVFAAPGPAAAAAGGWLLAALALAALVAWCNATSSAQLAALHPEAGGTYVHARERLGPLWGFLAGWAFVVGKTASLGAMALTFGTYAAPAAARPLAVAVVVAAVAVNVAGVERTAGALRVGVAVVGVTLALVVAAGVAVGFGGGATFQVVVLGDEQTDVDVPDVGRVTIDGTDAPAGTTLDDDGLRPPPVRAGGVLEAAGLLFFAFAGYARIATLGEEVRDPVTTIPRAITVALGTVVTTYAVVLGVALWALGPVVLATAPAPLVEVVAASPLSAAAGAVRVGAAVAAAGVLLSLLAGVSRTSLAMARRGELPRPLARVHPTRRTPAVAELTVGVVVVALVLVADLRGAIGASSFAVLAYYALANASAWRLSPAERRWPRWLAGLGVVLCVVVMASLPTSSVAAGAVLLAAGAGAWGLRRRPA
ncbi:MAG: APC family permease [Actinomycetes bacterium]